MAKTGKRYSEEQIIGILKEAAAAKTVGDVIRRHGISAHTYYRWKTKYAGMDVSDARRLRALEEENRRLKQLVAQAALDNQILKELLGKDS
jgi:putative transposase